MIFCVPTDFREKNMPFYEERRQYAFSLFILFVLPDYERILNRGFVLSTAELDISSQRMCS